MKSLKSITKYQRLPDEYQEVEWIKGNIDTGEIIIPSDTEETWEYTFYAEYIQSSLIATSVNSGYMQMFFTTQSDSQIVYYYFGFNNGTNSISSILNKKIIVRINKKALANDDTEKCYYTFIDAETNETLISRNTYKPAGGTQAWIDAKPKLYIKPAFKTYGFKKIGGKELVPCYRKSDSTVGMYDITNNEFIAATGTTDKGNDVKNYKESIKTNLLKYLRIPSEYQEVEWIKGNIDTGEELEPKNVAETYEIVQYMEGYDNGNFFSNDKNSSYCRLGLRFLNDVYKMWFSFGANNNTSANYAPLENKKIKIQLTKNAVADNGRMEASCKYYDENGTLLGTNSTYAPKETVDNWFTTFADGLPKLIIGSGYKLYSFKKVNGKELIPCYRKSDTTIGMYDITNNTFIAATGTTDKGNDVKHYIESIEKIIKTSKLPDAYQEVEYLESSGTQYINTGFYPCNNDIRLKFDALFYNTNDQRFCGSNNLVVAMSGTYASTFAIRKGAAWFEGNWAGTISTNIKTSFDVSVTSTQTVVKKNNETMATYSTTDSLSGDNSFLVFVSRYSPRNYLYGKLYSFQIYESGTLVRDLIPCYRKADNVIGMYDLANDMFYTNAGTGTFLKGKNIY